jgi:hypothetical protein
MFHQIVVLLKKTCKYFIIQEGIDKLAKFLIYMLKFIDATKSIYRQRPTFRY